MTVNLRGVWNCMKGELRQMMAQGSGAIAVAQTVAGTGPDSRLAAHQYAAPSRPAPDRAAARKLPTGLSRHRPGISSSMTVSATSLPDASTLASSIGETPGTRTRSAVASDCRDDDARVASPDYLARCGEPVCPADLYRAQLRDWCYPGAAASIAGFS